MQVMKVVDPNIAVSESIDEGVAQCIVIEP